jgi:hypothetical protein
MTCFKECTVQGNGVKAKGVWGSVVLEWTTRTIISSCAVSIGTESDATAEDYLYAMNGCTLFVNVKGDAHHDGNRWLGNETT